MKVLNVLTLSHYINCVPDHFDLVHSADVYCTKYYHYVRQTASHLGESWINLHSIKISYLARRIHAQHSTAGPMERADLNYVTSRALEVTWP